MDFDIVGFGFDKKDCGRGYGQFQASVLIVETQQAVIGRGVPFFEFLVFQPDDGWFNTGDMGIIDKRGNVYIKGRCKSLILSSNGQNIYPEEIMRTVNGKVPGYSQICRVEIVRDAFQKTPKQSIKRYLYK